MLADSGLHFIEAKCAEPFSYHSRSSLLSIREFRMHVEVAPLSDELLAKSFSGPGDVLFAGSIRGNPES